MATDSAEFMVAGWLRSTVVFDALIDRLRDSALQHLGLPSSLHQKLNNLQDYLLKIRSLLTDAEERQMMEERKKVVRQWLVGLIDLVSDADDMLDELSYRVLVLHESNQIKAVNNKACHIQELCEAVEDKVGEIQEKIESIAAGIKAAAAAAAAPPLPALGACDFSAKHRLTPRVISFEPIAVSIAPIWASLDVSAAMIGTSALQEYALELGLCDDLKMLQASLFKALAIVSIVNNLKLPQLKSDALPMLLRLLKDTAYDTDELLDELEYQHLKLKADAADAGFLNVAINFATQFIDWNDGATLKIKQVRETLDYIATDLKHYIECWQKLKHQQLLETSHLNRETMPLLTEAQVFGRDEERAIVIDTLLKSGGEDACADVGVPVLSIIGLGGVGKTTLAQLVYNDHRVQAHFEPRAWLSVSQAFDVKTLTKGILAAVSGERTSDYSAVTNLNRLQILLRDKLASKRFLLILDDLWLEDESKWETLCGPLMSGSRGSKILVTTRSQKVSDTLGASTPIVLRGLSDETFWQLFKRCTFGHLNSENYPQLEKLGKKISRRLTGLPLAARTLGNILNAKLEEGHWKSILESEIWELNQHRNDILPVLESSYHYLPAHLKPCFSYCALFPKGHQFDKDSLVEMWIAQGFVAAQGKARLEDVGSGYFDDLLHRSLFQKHHGRWTMHDFIHDLAQYASMDECFRIEDGKSQLVMPNTIRHLSVEAPCLQSTQFINWCRNKKLRTLIIFGESGHDLSHVLDVLKSEVTSIRVLGLGCYRMELLPSSICNLKHLRYLDLSRSRVRSLPRSLCSLYNLQSLKLSSYFPVCFPKDMTRMINLRHIDADKYSVSKITGIGKLTSLQGLSLFEIASKHGHMIGELRDMSELRGGLWIRNLQKLRSKEEVCQAKLRNKKYLTRLCLEWAPKYARFENDVEDEVVLEGLEPHPDLRRLEIRSYGGCKYPSWLDEQLCSNLEEIHFVGCESLEQLPPLGQLPFLKVLRFQLLFAVRRIGQEFCGTSELKGFPSLEELVFMGMPEWEEWSAGDSHLVFPHLRKLIIKYCPKLRKIPFLPPSLTELRLSEAGLTELPGTWAGHDHIIDKSMLQVSRTSSLSVLYIEKCQSLTSLKEWLLPSHLPCIKEIHVIECTKLSYLPIERVKELKCLECLELRDCPMLTPAVQSEELNICFPPPLRKLVLDSCGNLGMSLLGGLQNLTSLPNLEQLHIINFHELKSLPENGFPGSLKILNLKKCHPSLKDRCRMDGVDWTKIARIPLICID